MEIEVGMVIEGKKGNHYGVGTLQYHDCGNGYANMLSIYSYFLIDE